MEVGERIKEFRGLKKLTQKAFAGELDYSDVYISNVERGKVQPSRELIKKLTTVFGLSSDYILYGNEDARPKPKEFIARIEIVEKEKQMIERTEGPQYIEKFVPIPIALGKISGGPPRVVREDPDGVAIIYQDWARNRENFTAIWMVGESMEKTIPDGSLVGIDHSQKDIKELDGKIVAIRKNGEATIKRLRIVSKSLVLGLPDNPQFMKETIVLKGEQIDTSIVGKVAWWWGRQE